MTRNYLEHAKAEGVILSMFMHLADWKVKSPAAFRNAAIGNEGLIAINPLLKVTNDDQVNFLVNTISNTVKEGKMIDFGHIPNKVIKLESTRSREMFEAGEFQHPYENWLAVTSWEGGFNAYHISENPRYPGETLVLELYGVDIPGVGNSILVYDTVSIKPQDNHTLISPVPMDLPDGRIQTEVEIRERGANSLDPLVTLLRLLHDASIPITRFEAPARLNKARVKQGKPEIPAHTVLHTQNYVANFSSTWRPRSSDKGGTHASPIAHWRRSHLRHMNDGRIVPVKSTKVNWRDVEELHRLFYKVTT